MAFHQSNPYHPTAASSRVVASDGLQGVDDAGQICRVILTGLPKDDDVTETAVLDLVEGAIKAEAASARLTYDSTGQSLGLAIVTLFSFAHAKKLYEEIDGMIIDEGGERLSQSSPLLGHNERHADTRRGAQEHPSGFTSCWRREMRHPSSSQI
jgi:hypothetical protein